ncbi:unnamed protein product [Blumeria hordei]|uniref:Uncharacterized protein n=2 Tax=Blumeria hordei TaxID=2867405 RepID=A0A383UXC7_BLUHO|nr:unnamed protein product [Blumeria hordei]
MRLSNKCKDLACPMPGIYSSTPSSENISTLACSTILFVITFLGVGSLLFYKLFPLVSQHTEKSFHLPRDAPLSLRQKQAEHDARLGRRRIVALSFSATISLATVLAELILCEISNILDSRARALALKVVIPALLILLVVIIPFLELQSAVSATGWSFRRTANGKLRTVPWLLQALGFLLWLTGFWLIGKGIPGTYLYTTTPRAPKGLTVACIERVGVIGISLMALLSGFAAVSAAWHTFGTKSRIVSQVDLSRKQVGLDATNELLAVKRSRLRALQRKINNPPKEDFIKKVMGSLRGSADGHEIKSLELEISGLEYMASSLSASLNLLQNRLDYQRRASSPLGKVFLTPISYGFSIYGVYRIATVILSNSRRIVFQSPDPTTFANSHTDPVNRILSLMSKHVDPSINQLSWSRQISFLLTGVTLLATFNSVLTTFHMLTKLSPSLLLQTQANLALLIAQISATYVISSALLLRSNLPNEIKSVVSEALGSPLEPEFVEKWFDAWFLLACIGTAASIWLGRKLSSASEWQDIGFDGDVELAQKRS